MPFGQFFGALFFGLICGWFGLSLLVGHPAAAAKVAGTSLLVLGACLALGLLRQRDWARWAGFASAILLALLAVRMVVLDGSVLGFVTLFGASATALLLLAPATGRAAGEQAAGPGRDWLQLGTTVGIVGLLVAGWWATAPAATSPGSAAGTLPASAVSQRIRWQDFDSGLELAATEGRQVVATFVTDWCPYCSKMDKQTWRASSVIERMSDFVAVRVDAEQRQELTRRYGVQGFPANFLLAADGSVIARSDGYLTAGQLLSWIDRSVGRPAGRSTPAVLER